MHYETLPVIQNQNKFSSFECQLIIFSCFKVVQCAHLPCLLPPSTIGVVWWVRGHGQGPCFRLLLLLLQGQLDGCGRRRFGWAEERTEVKWKEEESVCQMSNTYGLGTDTALITFIYFYFKNKSRRLLKNNNTDFLLQRKSG